jgi:hypothetical protein
VTTDDLILALARQARPVTPLRPPAVRLLGWLALAALSATAGVWVYGLRPDSATMAASRGFAVDAVLALVILLSAAGAALLLAVPGAERRPVLRALALAAVVGWIALTIQAVWLQGEGLDGAAHWAACASRVASVALVPGLALLAMLGRGAPLRKGWAVGLSGAAAGAAGALAVLLTCPIVDPAHVLLGHVAPVALLGLGAAAFGARRR